MFTFGFSYIGLIYLLMLFIPNGIWVKNQPQGYNPENERKIYVICERIGQVLCTCCVLIFSDFNIHITGWISWLILSFAIMVLYDFCWIKYFKSQKTMWDYYKPVLGIKVPLATLPVIAFFLLGIYGTNIFMIVSSVILGIGHIGIHMDYYNSLGPAKSKKSVKIAKNIAFAILGLIFAAISFFIGARNINYMNHYSLINKGVDEGIYVELGGQEQYLLIRGADKTNPVIIFLHGGPSSPESYVNYSWVNDLLDEYTVIDWDQRGCGRTYIHNRDTDPNNETANYEQALTDLDELVDYACDRFSQSSVIIVGHSYGTVLGTDYINRHPEKVSSYVGIAQVVSMDINNRRLADDAIAMAESQGENYDNLTRALQAYEVNPCVATTMELRKEAMGYLPTPLAENSTWLALTSPYMGFPDFQWFLMQLGPFEDYIALNEQLYNSLLDYSLYDIGEVGVQTTFISGSLDYACPVSTIEDYIDNYGTNCSIYVIDDCGHNIQYTKPHDVSEIILANL